MMPRRARRCGWPALASVVIWCLVAPSPAAAFKAETHIWIAQQILNDLATCRIDDNPGARCLTVKLVDPVTHEVRTVKLQVDPGLAASLLQPQGQPAFRAGAVGPDAFPDLVGGQMTAHPGVGGKWQTDDWLKHLVTRAAPARHWFFGWVGSPEQAFAYGYLTHAAADVFAHSYINTYAGDVFLLTDGEQDVEWRHVILEGFIRNHTPALVDASGAPLGSPADLIQAPEQFLRKNLILNSSAASQYRESATTRHLASMYDYWNLLNRLIGVVDQSIDALNSKIAAVQGGIDDLKNMRVCTPRVFGWRKCFNLYPAGCFLDPATCLAIELTEHTVLDPLKAAATQSANEVKRPLVDTRAGVEKAIDEYIKTSEAITKEMMKPDGHPVQKLNDWVACWTPAFAGINTTVGTTGCVPVKLLEQGFNAARTVCDKLNTLGGVTWLFAPMCPVQAFIEQEVQQGLATDIAGLAGSNTFTSLVGLGTQESSAEAVNRQYSQDTSKPLIKIGDMAARAALEMHLGADDKFDPEAFKAAFDALQLAKLALVGPAELNRLVSEQNIFTTIYGPELYPENTMPAANVLFKAVRSIDGNQQWQEGAIPYPRESGPALPDLHYANYPYGYGFVNGTAGLRLWQDCEVRDLVFLNLFKGPLVESLDDKLAANDPNRADSTNPFPLGTGSVLTQKIDYSLPDGPYYVCGEPRPEGMKTRLPGTGSPAGSDTTPPSLTVPQNVVAECRDGVATNVDLGDPVVFDARDPNPTVSNDAPATFPCGRTTVTWTAIDHPAGNVAYGEQTVTVVDTTPPVFDATPEPMTFTANNPEGTTVTLTPPTATDGCEGVVSAMLAQPLPALPIGTRVVIWRAIDRAGNIAEISQTVTIQALPGDIDIDGDVDNDDLERIAAALGQPAQTVDDPRDVDGSGTIDLGDVRALFPLCTPNACHYDVCTLYDPSKAAKAGSTVPIKLQLCSASGINLSAPESVVNAALVRLISTATTGDVLDAGNANADSNFRFDASLGGTGGYIFNLKTAGLASGTYGLSFTATPDSTQHEVMFAVK